MGEGPRPFFEPSFNRSIKVQEGDDRLTSDAGFLLLREADHQLGLIESLAQRLRDPRQQELVRYTMPELCKRHIQPSLTRGLGFGGCFWVWDLTCSSTDMILKDV